MAPGGAIAMAAPLPGDTPHVWMCIAIPPDVSAGELGLGLGLGLGLTLTLILTLTLTLTLT